jgi:DNA polymerase/3'-5' exonuclease PolX
MNSQSIATYIANLEKENTDLRERLRKSEEEKAIMEYENMLHYVEVSDNESVASDSEYETETESESDDYFVCYNLPLTEAFDDLAQEEENVFKKSVYERAANIIYHLDFKLTNGEQISRVYGIGNGIIQKINEFLETGEIKRFKTFTTNENIAEQLDLLACVEKDTHKSEAYKKGAEAIRKLNFEVTNGTEISQGARKVPGIGKGIANKIDEYIVTGKIKNLGRLNIGPRRVVK